MKSIANRLFLFAAAALSLGTLAYGQTSVKADVPFAFRTPSGVSSAGHYTIQFDTVGGGKIAHFSNRETRQSVMALGYRLSSSATAAIAPRLVFRCGAAGCQLSEIWTATGGFGVPVHQVRDPEYTASIPLDVIQN
jgi:hypothetical protein